VWSRNLVNEGALAHCVLLRHGREEKSTNYRLPRCVIISHSLLLSLRSKYLAQRHVRLRF